MIKGELMDKATMMNAAASVVFGGVLGLVVWMAVCLWQHRPRRKRVTVIFNQPEPLTPEQEHVLYTTLQAPACS